MSVQPEPKTDFVPANEFVVNDLDTLKVLADPLRIRMLDLMRDPCTVKQVANELEIPPTKLYYHITQLEKHGLIVLVDTRIVSGIIEKHYQTAALTIHVKRQLLSPDSTEGLEITVSSLWQDVLEQLRESAAQGIIDTSEEDGELHPETLNLRKLNLALTTDQARDFLNRYDELLTEFRDLSEAQFNQSDVDYFRFFSVMFPQVHKRQNKGKSDS